MMLQLFLIIFYEIFFSNTKVLYFYKFIIYLNIIETSWNKNKYKRFLTNKTIRKTIFRQKMLQ